MAESITKPTFTSTYGILDVQKGRKKLATFLRKNPRLPVVIHAVITDPFGSDDGVSIEFNMEISRVDVRA